MTYHQMLNKTLGHMIGGHMICDNNKLNFGIRESVNDIKRIPFYHYNNLSNV